MSDMDPQVTIRQFSGRTLSAVPEQELSDEAAAGLRQFSLERLMGYGLAHADAVELRGRVAAGIPWASAASAIADDLRGTIGPEATRQSQVAIRYRASAMWRMAQAMNIEDTDARRAVFSRASALFEEASVLGGGCKSTPIPTSAGPLACWVYPAAGDRIGTAILIGGIEGWAMDFAEMSRSLADRGIETWALDGPGQGATRLLHGTYMTGDWRDLYAQAIAHVRATAPFLPLALIGNSIGGTLMLEMASRCSEVDLVCSNGGPAMGGSVLNLRDSKIRKKRMMCGPISEEEAEAVWVGVNILETAKTLRCPVLVIHGGLDPMISTTHMQQVFGAIGSADRQMVVFSDGDHCIYNHAEDKHMLIGDWVTSKARSLVDMRSA